MRVLNAASSEVCKQSDDMDKTGINRVVLCFIIIIIKLCTLRTTVTGLGAWETQMLTSCYLLPYRGHEPLTYRFFSVFPFTWYRNGKRSEREGRKKGHNLVQYPGGDWKTYISIPITLTGIHSPYDVVQG